MVSKGVCLSLMTSVVGTGTSLPSQTRTSSCALAGCPTGTSRSILSQLLLAGLDKPCSGYAAEGTEGCPYDGGGRGGRYTSRWTGAGRGHHAGRRPGRNDSRPFCGMRELVIVVCDPDLGGRGGSCCCGIVTVFCLWCEPESP